MSRSRDDTRVVGRRRGLPGGRRIPSRRFRPPPAESSDALRASSLPPPPTPDPDATPTVPPPAKTPVSLPSMTAAAPAEAPPVLEGWRRSIEARVASWSPARRTAAAAFAFVALTAVSYVLAR